MNFQETYQENSQESQEATPREGPKLAKVVNRYRFLAKRLPPQRLSQIQALELLFRPLARDLETLPWFEYQDPWKVSALDFAAKDLAKERKLDIAFFLRAVAAKAHHEQVLATNARAQEDYLIQEAWSRDGCAKVARQMGMFYLTAVARFRSAEIYDRLRTEDYHYAVETIIFGVKKHMQGRYAKNIPVSTEKVFLQESYVSFTNLKGCVEKLMLPEDARGYEILVSQRLEKPEDLRL